MPLIRQTNLVAYTEAATAWALNNPGVAPGTLSLECRTSCPQAKAAYFVAKLGSRDVPAGFGACNICGELTASWCEGCYMRCMSPTEPYIAASASHVTKPTRSVIFAVFLALTMPRDTYYLVQSRIRMSTRRTRTPSRSPGATRSAGSSWTSGGSFEDHPPREGQGHHRGRHQNPPQVDEPRFSAPLEIVRCSTIGRCSTNARCSTNQ